MLTQLEAEPRGTTAKVDVLARDHLVPFFSRLGYQEQRRIVHPEYGEVALMMCPADLDRLAAMRSPLIDDSVEVRRAQFAGRG